MSHRDPRGGMARRDFLSAAAATPAVAGIPISFVSAQEPKAATGKAGHDEK